LLKLTAGAWLRSTILLWTENHDLPKRVQALLDAKIMQTTLDVRSDYQPRPSTFGGGGSISRVPSSLSIGEAIEGAGEEIHEAEAEASGSEYSAKRETFPQVISSNLLVTSKLE
jgi:hypothetical protein